MRQIYFLESTSPIYQTIYETMFVNVQIMEKQISAYNLYKIFDTSTLPWVDDMENSSYS
jgi:hypothetical protein